jgi:TonB family protein
MSRVRVRAAVAAVVTLGICSGLFAQDDRSRALTAFRVKRFDAMIRNDVEAVAECLAEELTYTHSSGATETKAQFLETLRTGRVRYERIEPTDVAVHLYGDVVVVTGRSSMHVRSDGELQVFDVKFVEVDRWSDGRWQLIAWQSTRISSDSSPRHGQPIVPVSGAGQVAASFGTGAYRPGDGVSLPTLIREVKPQYTAEAMKAKIEGAVLLECLIGTDGGVADVKVSRSLDPTFGLDDVAVKAAKQWKFRPGMRNGEPVPVIVTIELAFTLKNDH